LNKSNTCILNITKSNVFAFFYVCFENRRDSVDRSPPRDGRPATFLSALEQLPEQHHHSVWEPEGWWGLHRRDAGMRRQESEGSPGGAVCVQPIFPGTVESESILYNIHTRDYQFIFLECFFKTLGSFWGLWKCNVYRYLYVCSKNKMKLIFVCYISPQKHKK